MNSRKGAYSQTWKYEDNDLRHLDDCDRQRNRHGSPWDSHNKYGREGHTNAERTRRNSEYVDSPKRLHGSDWNRRSPIRRQGPPSVTADKDFDRAQLRRLSTEALPERTPAEKRQFRHTEDTQYPEDFERGTREDFRHRKSPEKLNHRQHLESTYRQPPEHLQYRRHSEHNKDGRFHNRTEDRPQEWNSFSSRVYDKVRHGNHSPPSHNYEDHRTGIPMKDSSGQVFEAEHDIAPDRPPSDRTPQQNAASKGFQRFLNVLNKGVDVCMLTKIVGQAHTVGDETLLSQTSTAAKPSWSPPDDAIQQIHRNPPYWNENRGSQSEVVLEEEPRHFPAEGHRRKLQNLNDSDFEYGVGRCSMSDGNSLQKTRAESNFRSGTRSRSPSLVAETKIRPEDEQKRRQMQNLLQAIGVDLGLDELGQMSNRIQERLYGKKDSQRKEVGKERDKESRRMFSPRCHSRSSSSDTSTFIQLKRQTSLRKDSLEAPSDITDKWHTDENVHTCDRSSIIPVKVHGNNGGKPRVAFHSSVSTGTSNVPEPSHMPVKPVYTTAPYSQFTYPEASVPPWGAPATVPPWPYPPVYPHMYPPMYPPMYPSHLSGPNVNTSSSSAPGNALLQGSSSHKLDPLEGQTSASRPRYLQVINTTQ